MELKEMNLLQNIQEKYTHLIDDMKNKMLLKNTNNL